MISWIEAKQFDFLFFFFCFNYLNHSFGFDLIFRMQYAIQ